MSWLDRVLAAPGVRIEHVDEELEAEAWAWLRVHDERPYSFVDATSFALMRKLRLTDVRLRRRLRRRRLQRARR